MFIRSKADPSIIGLVMPNSIDGWNAVKLSMSEKGFSGESPIGHLFNATPQCWYKVESHPALHPDIVQSYQAWVAAGRPMFDDVNDNRSKTRH